MNVIHSFTDIPLHSGALYVLDIDDTVFYLEGLGKLWWRASESVRGRAATIEEWIRLLPDSAASLTCPSVLDFLERIRQVGAKLIFLTARRAELREVTERQLAACGIEVGSSDIYFNEKKGEALREILSVKSVREVVFVDDMEHNLESVRAALEGICKLDLFLFSTG